MYVILIVAYPFACVKVPRSANQRVDFSGQNVEYGHIRTRKPMSRYRDFKRKFLSGCIMY